MILDWIMFWALIGIGGAVLCTVGAILVALVNAIRGKK